MIYAIDGVGYNPAPFPIKSPMGQKEEGYSSGQSLNSPSESKFPSFQINGPPAHFESKL